jgi:hypothetical protein
MFGFPWIPLAESGLFKGLQRIQIKNLFRFGLACLVVRQMSQARVASSSGKAAASRRFDSGSRIL